MPHSSSSPRYVFITGGVVSSLGKGIVASSLGTLMQARGYSVRLRKLDPYLNPDPGTMNPAEHGEVFVTDDGCETDLDLGHYERFTDIPVKKTDNITSGKIYLNLLKKERQGAYLGRTIQVVPHVTDDIKEFLTADIHDEDFVFCEIGGTIGDIESLPFLEAIRQFGVELGHERVAFIHITLLPYLKAANELKTKPTQHSVRELRAAGIHPDILVCRSEIKMSTDIRHKIANMCSVKYDSVISAVDTNKTIYEAPINYHKEGLDGCLIKHFSCDEFANNKTHGAIKQTKLVLSRWNKIIETASNLEGELHLAVIGKYFNEVESYKSLVEAINHAGLAHQKNITIHWIDSKVLGQKKSNSLILKCSGILVPGGFGKTGIEGKIIATKFAIDNDIPFLGICLGMQIAVITLSRAKFGLTNANSTEFDQNTKDPVVCLLNEWNKEDKIVHYDKDGDLGGTMRLGSYPCKISQSTLLRSIYDKENVVNERHRHRYEINSKYIKIFNDNGLMFSGTSPDGALLEACEYKHHPWFLGVQFHPELLSRPFRPHPIYLAFIKAMIKKSRTQKNEL